MKFPASPLEIGWAEGDFRMARPDTDQAIYLQRDELRWLCIQAGPAMLNAHPESPPELPRFKKDPGRPFDLHVPEPIPGQEALDLEP